MVVYKVAFTGSATTRMISFQVTAQLRPAIFHLSDRSGWHQSRLRKVAMSPATDQGSNIDSGFISGDMDFPAEEPPAPAEDPPEPATRPVRARSCPGKSQGKCN
ncbi:unnamed protein product [Arctogadus glacialis]